MAKILILDDSEVILDLYTVLVNIDGHDAITVTNQVNFDEKLAETIPDLIILDILVGDVDGREICHTIKSSNNTKHIPVILISANHHLLSDNNLCEPDAIMEKPFNIGEFRQKISNILDRQPA